MGTQYQVVSSTATATAITFPKHTRSVTLINDGANEVYFSLDTDADTARVATTGSGELKAGESLTFSITGPNYWTGGSIVCDTAETATVRVFTIAQISQTIPHEFWDYDAGGRASLTL